MHHPSTRCAVSPEVRLDLHAALSIDGVENKQSVLGAKHCLTGCLGSAGVPLAVRAKGKRILVAICRPSRTIPIETPHAVHAAVVDLAKDPITLIPSST